MLTDSVKGDINKQRYMLDTKGILRYQNGKSQLQRVVLPPAHYKALTEYLHKNSLSGGHVGHNTMIEEIKKAYYWPGYADYIREYVKCCTCQWAKDLPNRKLGEMINFEPEWINDMVCIDHIGPLLETDSGNKYITTYYDRYSGYTKSIATDSIDSFTTATNFIRYWVCQYGAPKYILTDLGPDFNSEIMDHLCSLIDTGHRFTTSYHAQTDGAVERFNKTLKTMLKCIAIDKDLDFGRIDSDPWDLFVEYINSIHNNRLSARTRFKLCPNQIFIGRRLQLPFTTALKDLKLIPDTGEKNKRYNTFIKDMLRIYRNTADEELKKYNIRKEIAYNKDKKAANYKTGELVKLWKGIYPAKGRNKLAINWQGPYKIVQVFNNGVNYILQSLKFPAIFITANVQKITRYKVHKSKGEYIDLDDSSRNKRLYRDNNGIYKQCTIISLISGDDVLIEFEDGTEIECGTNRLNEYNEEKIGKEYKPVLDEKWLYVDSNGILRTCKIMNIDKDLYQVKDTVSENIISEINQNRIYPWTEKMADKTVQEIHFVHMNFNLNSSKMKLYYDANDNWRRCYILQETKEFTQIRMIDDGDIKQLSQNEIYHLHPYNHTMVSSKQPRTSVSNLYTLYTIEE